MRPAFRTLCALLIPLLVPAGVGAVTDARPGDDVAAERLHLASTRRGLIDVEWPGVPAHLAWDVALWAGYAHEPVAVYRVRRDEPLGALVASRVGGSLVAAFGVKDVLGLDLELPVILSQDRAATLPGATAPGAQLATLAPAGLGDVRLRARYQFLLQSLNGLDASIGVGISAPTGGAHDHFGDASVTLIPELSVGRAGDTARVALNVAAHLLRDHAPVLGTAVGDEVLVKLGVGWRSGDAGEGPLEVDTALSGAFATGTSVNPSDARALEWRLQVAYDLWKTLQAFVGGGLGLLPGWGTPDFRAFAGLRLAPWKTDPPPDADQDGVADALEGRPECVTQPEDKDGFQDDDGCPDLDDDADGLPDLKEARPECRLQPEDKDGFQDEDGCPEPDNDQDGLLDADDKCPIARGPKDNNGCPRLDTDKDGFGDDDEKCPLQPEDKDGFEDLDGCPDLDNDQDGVPDTAEPAQCVNVPEDKDGFEDQDGCPDPDNDFDQIPDLVEARPECANLPEDVDGFEDMDGCPDPDNDQDGVPDPDDKCVLEKGPVENRGCPDSNRDADEVVDRLDNCPDEAGPATNSGCPEAKKQLVVIRTGKLEILEAVFFATGKDIVLERSFALLDNVAQVVLAHPEVEHLRIEGHTDNKGKAAANKDLSERRAKSVRRYLEGKGVETARLEAVGYGPDKPIADNATEDGRAKNRRVEFNVIAPASNVVKAVPVAPRPPGAVVPGAPPPAAPKAPTPAPEGKRP